MYLKMLSRIVMRKDLNRRSNCVPILPFCYKLYPNVKPFVDSLPIQREITTNSERNTENKQKTNNNIEENPFYSKYSEKIKKSINQKSINSSKTDSNIDNILDNKEIQNEEISHKKTEINEKIQKMRSRSAVNQTLDDILKLDQIKDKSSEEITEIWKSYHKSKDCIYAVIPSHIYDTMFWTSNKYKTFILPIPRISEQNDNQNNYEFILSQFDGHKCFFTPLIAYQRHKELSPICLTINHFPELQKEKQIVLMYGQYDNNLLNGFEAQCLANQLQWYYSAQQNVRQTILLHQFNCEPSFFNHMQLIDELENNILSLGMTSKQNPK